MIIVRLIKSWVEKLMTVIRDILVPEDTKIQKLLALPLEVMRDLLPKSPVFVKDVSVLFDYQNKIVRLIVKSIKYKNNYSLRKRIATYLYEEIVEMSSDIALFDGKPPLLVPMPMSSKERRQRGFNQCEEMCKEIKKISGGNIEISFNILKKTKETKRQTGLDREQRQENIKNSMSVSEQARGRAAIILDDVYTTGATLEEARRALFSAGAKRAIGLFIAH